VARLSGTSEATATVARLSGRPTVARLSGSHCDGGTPVGQALRRWHACRAGTVTVACLSGSHCDGGTPVSGTPAPLRSTHRDVASAMAGMLASADVSTLTADASSSSNCRPTSEATCIVGARTHTCTQHVQQTAHAQPQLGA